MVTKLDNTLSHSLSTTGGHTTPRSARTFMADFTAQAMHSVPRQYRYKIALAIATVIQPFFKGGRNYFFLWRLNSTKGREYALWRILQYMDWHGVGFDPRLSVKGAEELSAAMSRGHGVLVVASHMLLNHLTVRYVDDAGYAAKTVTREPWMKVQGTDKLARIIRSSPTYMVTIRKWLSGGGLVMSMIDQGNWSMRNAVEFETANGKMMISNSLIRLAVQLNVPVLFTASRLVNGQVEITFAAPADTSEGDVQAITSDFISFLQAYIAS